MTQFQLSLWTALIVWAGFLDKAFLHTFFYRPICIGPLVGLLFGNLPMGLIAGVTIELMFLATVFVGTVTPPDEVTSAALATAFACISGNLWAGIAVAIPIGIAGQRLKQIRNNTAFEYTQKKLEEAAARASARGIVAWATVMPTLIESLFFAVPSFLLLYFAAAPLQRAFDRLPTRSCWASPSSAASSPVGSPHCLNHQVAPPGRTYHRFVAMAYLVSYQRVALSLRRRRFPAPENREKHADRARCVRAKTAIPPLRQRSWRRRIFWKTFMLFACHRKRMQPHRSRRHRIYPAIILSSRTYTISKKKERKSTHVTRSFTWPKGRVGQSSSASSQSSKNRARPRDWSRDIYCYRARWQDLWRHRDSLCTVPPAADAGIPACSSTQADSRTSSDGTVLPV